MGDALSLVVVDPVRGVGQALDAVEVGHVVLVGFGKFGLRSNESDVFQRPWLPWASIAWMFTWYVPGLFPM